MIWKVFGRALLIAIGVIVILVVAAILFVRGPFVGSIPDPPPEMEISQERLKASVRVLSIDMTPRWYTNVDNLDRAARWIEDEFRSAGLVVTTQEFRLREGLYRNVIARREGEDLDSGAVIVGAHYDAYGELPGADDNASGVAVLLELARTLPAVKPRRTQIFVAFANEEPPLFGSDDMGSAHYARKILADGQSVDLMIALDLVGYFSDEPGSQRYPFKGLGYAFPNVGNFIAVVGDARAGRWIEDVKRGMLSSRALPVVSFRAPSVLQFVHYSDHKPFRELGLPGVMVTDTAFLRTPHYHRRTDTIDTLNFPQMARVVRALHGVLHDRNRPH